MIGKSVTDVSRQTLFLFPVLFLSLSLSLSFLLCQQYSKSHLVQWLNGEQFVQLNSTPTQNAHSCTSAHFPHDGSRMYSVWLDIGCVQQISQRNIMLQKRRAVNGIRVKTSLVNCLPLIEQSCRAPSEHFPPEEKDEKSFLSVMACQE